MKYFIRKFSNNLLSINSLIYLCLVITALMSTSLTYAELNTQPVNITPPVKPNAMVLLDNSRSMYELLYDNQFNNDNKYIKIQLRIDPEKITWGKIRREESNSGENDVDQKKMEDLLNSDVNFMSERVMQSLFQPSIVNDKYIGTDENKRSKFVFFINENPSSGLARMKEKWLYTRDNGFSTRSHTDAKIHLNKVILSVEGIKKDGESLYETKKQQVSRILAVSALKHPLIRAQRPTNNYDFFNHHDMHKGVGYPFLITDKVRKPVFLPSGYITNHVNTYSSKGSNTNPSRYTINAMGHTKEKSFFIPKGVNSDSTKAIKQLSAILTHQKESAFQNGCGIDSKFNLQVRVPSITSTPLVDKKGVSSKYLPKIPTKIDGKPAVSINGETINAIDFYKKNLIVCLKIPDPTLDKLYKHKIGSDSYAYDPVKFEHPYDEFKLVKPKYSSQKDDWNRFDSMVASTRSDHKTWMTEWDSFFITQLRERTWVTPHYYNYLLHYLLTKIIPSESYKQGNTYSIEKDAVCDEGDSLNYTEATVNDKIANRYPSNLRPTNTQSYYRSNKKTYLEKQIFLFPTKNETNSNEYSNDQCLTTHRVTIDFTKKQDDGTYLIPQDNRASAVKIALNNIIEDKKEALRFCLATLATHERPEIPIIRSDCKDSVDQEGNDTGHIAELKEMLDEIYPMGRNPSGATPLAKTYYEIIRFFAGKEPFFYNSPSSQQEDIIVNGVYQSPIEYRCQPNYVIVTTDGLPSKDLGRTLPYKRGKKRLISAEDWMVGFSGDFTLEHGSRNLSNQRLLNWDGENDDLRNGVYYWVDDLALFAREIDLRYTDETDKRQNSSFGKAYGRNMKFLKHPLQNITTHTLGVGGYFSYLKKIASHGGGVSLHGLFPEDIRNKLSRVMMANTSMSYISSKFQDTPFRVDDKAITFYMSYRSGSWDGSISAWTGSALLSQEVTGEIFFNDEKVDGKLTTDTNTNSSKTIDGNKDENKIFKNNRRIISSVVSLGNGSTSTDEITFPKAFPTTSPSDILSAQIGYSPNIRKYFHGSLDSFPLDTSGYVLSRSRNKILGPIIHSRGAYVSNEGRLRYFSKHDSHLTNKDDRYPSFVEKIKSRKNFLYVGTNSGFLHAFSVEKKLNTEKTKLEDIKMVEEFAFIPNTTRSKMPALIYPDYTHNYTIDGTSAAYDVLANNKWKTLLLTTFGNGGTGIFALDITNPNPASGKIFKWEINHHNPASTGGSTISMMASNKIHKATPSNYDYSIINKGTKQTLESGSGLSIPSVDGDKSNLYTDPSLLYELDKHQFISSITIDLPSEYEIIHDSKGYDSKKIMSLSVFISDKPLSSISNFNDNFNVPDIFFAAVPQGSEGSIKLDVNTFGKYVLIQARGESHLKLNGVDIKGSPTASALYKDMGHLQQKPSVIVTPKNIKTGDEEPTFYFVTGNGVYSEEGKSVVYIIDPETGTPHQTIEVKSTAKTTEEIKNGMGGGISGVAAIDTDKDYFIDRIYASDILGEIFSLNWDNDKYKFINNASPLFKVNEEESVNHKTGGVQKQYITAPMEVSRSENGEDFMIYFGTGRNNTKYDVLKNINEKYVKQSFYAVRDRRGATNLPLTTDKLMKREMFTSNVDASGIKKLIGVKDVDSTESAKTNGWYIDLLIDSEQVTSKAIIHGEDVLFHTNIIGETMHVTERLNDELKINDQCITNSDGHYIQLNRHNGGAPKKSILNKNPVKEVSLNLNGEEHKSILSGLSSGYGSSGKQTGAPLFIQITQKKTENSGFSTYASFISDSAQSKTQKVTDITKRLSWIKLE